MLSILILGIIQGIAEFLPISSSAHLIIFRDVFGIGSSVISNDVSMAFDIALHLGTLGAIGIYFFKDFIDMIFKGLTKGPKDKEGKLFWFIVVGTIPAAIAGVLFEDIIEEFFRKQFILIALALIFMGIVIYLLDSKSEQNKSIQKMTFKDALIIGCSQIFALVPGFSRSGTTIACARALKLNREDSAKFSFYLSAPIVLGSVVLFIIKEDFNLILNNLDIFITGVLTSFVIGLLCINFFLKYLRKNDFKLFMIYRIVIGVVVILWVLF